MFGISNISLRVAMVAISVATATTGMAATDPKAPTQEQILGRFIYFDKGLSNPVGQACASCHLPKAGFADPDQELPVSEGAVTGRFGGRNAPSSAYAAFSPIFAMDPVSGNYRGGQFWDGRAPNLEEQAKGPFLNPVEMNNSKEGVVDGVRNSNYADLFRQVYGAGSLDDVDTAYNLIAKALASFESSSRVNRFTSKYDYYLKGKVELTTEEKRGLELFNGRGNCSVCHPSAPAAEKTPPMFTDFTYENLGIPRNMEFPYYMLSPSPYPDMGLGAIVDDLLQAGKFKVMTLRNIALTAPYSHNGYFKTLKEVIHFLNTRDIPGLWPAPDVEDNVTADYVGRLGLSEVEEDDIAAFLRTLTDGYLCTPDP